jgi:GNAT superfamily N-acetyltransferase
MEVRAATAADMDGVRILADAYGNLSHWPMRPDYLDHELAADGLWVADDGDEVVGFAGVLERGEVAYLADLFVRQDLLGKGIGRALLEAAFGGADAPVRATCASGDPRALPLYVSFGMRPIAPLLYLSGDRASGLRVPMGDGEGLREAAPDDPQVVDLDAAVGGRRRDADLAFLGDAGALAFVLRDGREAVAAAIVRISAVTGSMHAREAFVAPSFARSEEAAARVTLSTVVEGAGRADAVHVVVPGPHPALGPLLAGGFRIVDRDTVMASRLDLFDLTRQVPSPELG